MSIRRAKIGVTLLTLLLFGWRLCVYMELKQLERNAARAYLLMQASMADYDYFDSNVQKYVSKEFLESNPDGYGKISKIARIPLRRPKIVRAFDGKILFFPCPTRGVFFMSGFYLVLVENKSNSEVIFTGNTGVWLD